MWREGVRGLSPLRHVFSRQAMLLDVVCFAGRQKEVAIGE